ncbi:pyridine nucleotide-disulfide oxidoreductase family protein [Thozetella sp. PMI_491]|nr:pyridine nucleotide-disulfide oxidoreductase family protein [Thozetella sp. PMI_491]
MQTKLSALAAAVLAGAQLVQADCAADNCLRALRATQTPGRLEAAQSFCSSFTAPAATVTAIPSYAASACVPNQNGDTNFRISSACSCLPTPTIAPCAAASSSWAAQVATAPQATPTVPATLAYECLKSVPLGKDAAIALVDALPPYLEWQSDVNYKKDPPAGYPFPGYDMFANLAAVRAKIVANAYESEYDFQADLFLTVFAPGHDGHFYFYPDALTSAFTFARAFALVSISEDGKSLPVIKVYDDVISSPQTASELTHINGVEAAKFVEDLMATATYNQDMDAAYNTAFFSLANQASGFTGYFEAVGRVNRVYHGPNTTFTFANGTELTLENKARVIGDLTGVVDGPSFYTKFCSGSAGGASALASSEDALTNVVVGPGYPEPVHTTADSIVSCYYLNGEGYEDVAVIALLAMESESIPEFQSVVQECIASAVADGKTKLVVDLQANGGGYILLGYDFYRELFPHIMEDGFSRWPENDGFMAASRIDSDLVEGLNPYTSDNADLVGDYEWWFNYRYDYNITGQPFLTFEDKFAPHVYQDTKYTNIMRWNLNDNLTTTNTTYGMGIPIAGYGPLANLTQPFEAENIVLLYDGVCASTCTIASEMLRIQGGVKSIAMGGRPVEGSIQGVGGIKGSQSLGMSNVYSYMSYFSSVAETEEQNATFARYTTLPLERSTAAGINARDAILRDNVNDGIPAQYVNEPADCRLYWTAPMLSDMTEVWKAAAHSAFSGGSCAAGGISAPAKKDRKREGAETPKVFAPRVPDEKRAELFQRAEAQNSPMWNARYRLKAIP